MAPFFPLGKKPEPKTTAQNYIPINEVKALAAEGKDERAIISELLGRGFTHDQIIQAFKAILKSEVGKMPEERTAAASPVEVSRHPQMMPEQRRSIPLPVQRQPQAISAPELAEQLPQVTGPMPMGMPPEHIIASPPTELPAAPGFAPKEVPEAAEMTFEKRPEEAMLRPQIPPVSEITLEEVIEGVIEEKWNVFEERFSDFEKKDLQLQQQIEDMRHKIDDLEITIREKEKTLAEKFDEGTDRMSLIEGKIGSIEKVFKETLPELTTNIRMLRDSIEKKQEKS